jgi:triacylglycerol lipase
MSTLPAPDEAPAPPLRGELRYGLELARLLVDRDFHRPGRRASHPPALLVPGFMAGDQSLAVLAGWLRRRGARTSAAGIRLNVDCAERAMTGIERRLALLVERAERPVVVIGQSRGGSLARVAAVRNPDLVSAVVMLGSPVLDPLSVGPGVLRTVRSVARLGDLGVPWTFSSECKNGSCCESFRADLEGPIPGDVRAVAIYSRSDGIVSWQACLDRCAEHVEVDSSHTGMSVNVGVFRMLARVLDAEEDRWTG